MAQTPPCLMVIGAHAGDAEIMAGATVLKHVAAGWRAVLVHLTLGEKGHPTLAPEEYAPRKRAEAEAAARLLGATCVVLPYPDGELPVSAEVQWALADLIREHRPTVLLTHWRGSMHRDHRHTHLNVLEALFYARLPAFRRAHPAHGPARVYYAENWEDQEGFQPEVYLEVTEVFDRYLEAIRAYSLFRGEVVSFPYEQWYQGMSAVRGAEVGVPRAVALMRPEGRRRRRVALLDAEGL
jgi:LmbE family N-acetylglucosaminyl deacetylase